MCDLFTLSCESVNSKILFAIPEQILKCPTKTLHYPHSSMMRGDVPELLRQEMLEEIDKMSEASKNMKMRGDISEVARSHKKLEELSKEIGNMREEEASKYNMMRGEVHIALEQGMVDMNDIQCHARLEALTMLEEMKKEIVSMREEEADRYKRMRGEVRGALEQGMAGYMADMDDIQRQGRLESLRQDLFGEMKKEIVNMREEEAEKYRMMKGEVEEDQR
jgi:hypothetical protein